MRDRVRLQRSGEYDPWTGPTWETVGEFWAEFRPGSGREFREGTAQIGEERATFALNYREDIRQIDRLVHLGRGGNRIWDIKSVGTIGFKDGILVMATKPDNLDPVE
jgi:head-tail adaptor